MHSNCTPLNEIRCYAYFWFPISLFYLKACPLYCTKMHDTIHSIQFVLYLFISLVNFFGRLHTEVVFYLPVSCKVSILSIEGFLKWVYLSSPPPPQSPPYTWNILSSDKSLPFFVRWGKMKTTKYGGGGELSVSAWILNEIPGSRFGKTFPIWHNLVLVYFTCSMWIKMMCHMSFFSLTVSIFL